MRSKLFKIWNKETCFEIYFRPLPETSMVEVTTYLNGDPFVNPRCQQPADFNDDNQEVWSVEDARECWDAWVNHGGYEVSEVEDYLRPGEKEELHEQSGKYMMDLHKKPERLRIKKQRVKKAMTKQDNLKRMMNEQTN